MPTPWAQTIDAHRRGVRDSILDTAAALVAERGLRSVTMSDIAHRAGIARATLYRYFPHVEDILLAWHDRQVAAHLRQLAEVRDRPGDHLQRLQALLEAYALIARDSRSHQDADLAALLHRGTHVPHAERRLHAMVRDLLAEAAAAGAVRTDVPPEELADYCLEALSAARRRPSRPAIARLVRVVLSGTRPPR